MNKTFVWGHRGAGFTGIQNTIASFQEAIDMGVDGIKTEARLTKDGVVVLCFYNDLEKNGEHLPINQLTLQDIKNYPYEGNETIPTLREFFEIFHEYDIRYNFDITEPDVGIEIIKIAREFGLIDRVEITKPAVYPYPLHTIFAKIRDFDDKVTLINSVFLKHSVINEETIELEAMRELDVQAVNLKFDYANYEIFKMVKKLGFKFYVWDILFRRSMEKFLRMNYNNNRVDAIYSNLPERLLSIRDEIQNS